MSSYCTTSGSLFSLLHGWNAVFGSNKLKRLSLLPSCLSEVDHAAILWNQMFLLKLLWVISWSLRRWPRKVLSPGESTINTARQLEVWSHTHTHTHSHALYFLMAHNWDIWTDVWCDCVSVGYFICFLTLLNIVLLVGSTAFSNWWLSFWLGQGDGVRPTHRPLFWPSEYKLSYYLTTVTDRDLSKTLTLYKLRELYSTGGLKQTDQADKKKQALFSLW